MTAAAGVMFAAFYGTTLWLLLVEWWWPWDWRGRRREIVVKRRGGVE